MDQNVIDRMYQLALSKIEDSRNKGEAIPKDMVDKIIEKVIDVSKLLEERDITPQEINRLKFLIQSHHNIDLSSEAIILGDNSVQRWFDDKKTEIEWKYWNRYKKSLIQQKRPRSVIEANERVIDNILDFSGDPCSDQKSWSRKGLVMGNVQSGKTQNYIGLINKAFDSGYRVVILFGGHMNELRNQTQLRVDNDVIGLESKHLIELNQTKKRGVGLIDSSIRVATLTSTEGDFNAKTAKTLRISLTDLSTPLIITMKKNTSVLGTLIKYIKETSMLEDGQKIDVPMLLIDDEADWGSINSQKMRDKISKTNEKIRELLSLFSKNHYVGYTATPFANIFIDPNTEDDMLNDDLFPKDYMIRIPVPENYCGQDFFFSDDAEDKENPSIIEIDDNESMLKMSHNTDNSVDFLCDSLKEAVLAFIISTSLRMGREGQAKSHNTMMVNITRLKLLQNQIRGLIDDYLTNIKNNIEATNGLDLEDALGNETISEIKNVFEKYYSINDSFTEVRQNLYKAASKIKVLAVNSESNTRLDYSVYQDNGLCVIAVGGHTLARGLTLEGLTISYFARNSKMYDTLMQMCRWFGYRPNYDDLCKVFMPEESKDWYKHIAGAINDLYAQLKLMNLQEKTPSDFGLQVRSHPGNLMVTARNKLDASVEKLVKVSLWGSRMRRLRFKNDNEKNNKNFELISKFIASLKFNNEEGKKELIFQDVEHEKVISLVKDLDLIPDDIGDKATFDFIRKLEEFGLKKFRVKIFNTSKEGNQLWMQKASFTDSYSIAGRNLRIPRRKMKSNGVVISNPKSELGSPDDEKLLFYKHERNQIEQSESFVKSSNIPYLQSELRDFPGLIIYLFNIAVVEPFSMQNAKLEDIDVSQPFDKPAVGLSFSFPIENSAMKGMSASEIKHKVNESKYLYRINKQKQLELEFSFEEETFEEHFEDD